MRSMDSSDAVRRGTRRQFPPGEIGRARSESLRTLQEAEHLFRDLRDDADKEALQRQFAAITSSMKLNVDHARPRLTRLLDELRRRS